jgi:hypothetical protein
MGIDTVYEQDMQTAHIIQPAEEMAAIIQQFDNIVIVAHGSPDGDAIGATGAMGSLVKALGKRFVLYNATGIPDYLEWVPLPGKLVTKPSAIPFKPGLIIVLDCGEDKPDSDIRYYGLSTTDAYREQEARWLKGVVESEEYRAAPLHIVVLHMIPGGKSSWHGEQEIRRLFVPILNEASVDIMLCGHYHRYQWIDDGSRGTNFPILVNSNRDKLVVKADRRGIDIDVVNTGGEVIKRHRIDK